MANHVSMTQLFILNTILHCIALFLSYHYYFSENSFSIIKNEIFLLLETILWLILSQLFKIQSVKRVLKKVSPSLVEIWFKSWWIFRLFGSAFILLIILWNDNIRLLVCSYLSSLSINQYIDSQKSVLQYSSQSVITTGTEVNYEQAPSNSDPTPTISIHDSSTRRRRGGAVVFNSNIPPHNSKTTIRMKHPERAPSQKDPSPRFTPVYHTNPVDEVWGGNHEHSLNYNAVEDVRSGTDMNLPSSMKRKLDAMDVEPDLTESPPKKRETVPNLDQPSAPTEKVISAIVVPASNQISSKALDIDSKKRQREAQVVDVGIDEKDSVTGTRKMSRKCERSLDNEHLNMQVVVPLGVNILDKPFISLQPTSETPNQEILDQKHTQQIYQRPALKSRYAISAEEYSKRRSMSFEVDDSGSPGESSEHDRLVATIAMNRRQVLEATEKLLKSAVVKKDPPHPEPSAPAQESNLNSSYTPPKFSLSEQSPSFQFNSEKTTPLNTSSSASPATPFVFGKSTPDSQIQKQSSVPTSAVTLTTANRSTDSEAPVLNKSPPSSTEFQLERTPSLSLKKPPPSPTVRKPSFDEKRNGIAFLPTTLNPLPPPPEGVSVDANKNENAVSASSVDSRFSATPTFAPNSSVVFGSQDKNLPSSSTTFSFLSKENSTTSSFGSKPLETSSQTPGPFGSNAASSKVTSEMPNPFASSATKSISNIAGSGFTFGQSSSSSANNGQQEKGPSTSSQSLTFGGFGSSALSGTTTPTPPSLSISNNFGSTAPIAGFGSLGSGSTSSTTATSGTNGGFSFGGSSQGNLPFGKPTSSLGSPAVPGPFGSSSFGAPGSNFGGGQSMTPSSNGFNSGAFNSSSYGSTMAASNSGGFSMGMEQKSDRKKVKPKFHTKK